MYDGGHFASFICPHNIALLSFTYMRVSVPYVVICCIPFLFAFSLLLLHFCALPQIRPYKSSFIKVSFFLKVHKTILYILQNKININHQFSFYQNIKVVIKTLTSRFETFHAKTNTKLNLF